MNTRVIDDLLHTSFAEQRAGRKLIAVCISDESRMRAGQEMHAVMRFNEPPTGMPLRTMYVRHALIGTYRV